MAKAYGLHVERNGKAFNVPCANYEYMLSELNTILKKICMSKIEVEEAVEEFSRSIDEKELESMAKNGLTITSNGITIKVFDISKHYI